MPRIKDFNKLPTWLQERLINDWRNLSPNSVEIPPIRDPEYRVYLISDTGAWADGGGLWLVDAGTGGVTVETAEARSVAYVDLPDDSEVKVLIDQECRRLRDERDIERLYDIIMGYGVNPIDFGSRVNDLRQSGCDAGQVLKYLVKVLHDGLFIGKWPVA